MSNEIISYSEHSHLPYHKSIRLQNFTVFRDVTLDFVPGVNVFIGANGTGKTHLLKALYTSQYTIFEFGRGGLSVATFNFKGVFQSDDSPLIRKPALSSKDVAVVSGTLGNYSYDRQWNFTINQDSVVDEAAHRIADKMPRPIFVPSIDMMAHTHGFVSTYSLYSIDFDQTYRDITTLLLAPKKRSENEHKDILKTLRDILGGDVESEGERFYLRTPQGRFAMPLVAEGLRKIATLYQLLKNGFLKPGDVLFWDEPEVNLNPSLMDELIGVLLALARTGVQIFLATHSYVILKELDLQSTAADKVRYFALEPTDDGTVVHATDDYSQIEPNAIADQYDSMYDRQLTRSTGRTRAK